jgi:hypothetical protein
MTLEICEGLCAEGLSFRLSIVVLLWGNSALDFQILVSSCHLLTNLAYVLSLSTESQAIVAAFRLPAALNLPFRSQSQSAASLVLRLLRSLGDSPSIGFFDLLDSDGPVTVYT